MVRRPFSFMTFPMPLLRAFSCALLALCAAVIVRPLAAAEPAVWQAQYPLMPDHPVVSEGWTVMAQALQPEIDLQLRLGGPRLGTPAALETLSLGTHQIGLIALASHPDDFPYWAMLGELFLASGESLASAAAITELVMRECPPCQQNFRRKNLVFLGTYGAAPYRLIATRPLAAGDGLKGQTVATPGSLWDRLVEHLGAATVPPQTPARTALAEGEATALIDIAAALTLPPLARHKLVVTKLPLGSYRGAGPFMINRDAWSDLTADQRKRLFAAAAEGIVRITATYRRQAAAELLSAEEQGAAIAPSDPQLTDRIRRFAASDQDLVVASAKARFGIADAERFVQRLTALYDKYVALLDPEAAPEDAIRLLTSEIFDRLDPETYGLQ